MASGRDPGFMVGGIAKNFQANYRVGGGPYVVLEGDEYDTAFFDKRPKFVHFKPKISVLTSVEFDHADIYADLNAVIRAFEGFLAELPPQSLLLACGDALLVSQVSSRSHAPVRTYGLAAEAFWRAAEIAPAEGGMRFQVLRQGEPWGEFFSPLWGAHNVANALAALAVLARELPKLSLPEALSLSNRQRGLRPERPKSNSRMWKSASSGKSTSVGTCRT